ncbi:protein of unknown function (plasmid) [Caballeronia sp. S22]
MTRRAFYAWLTAAEIRKSPSGFTLDERFQCFAHQRRFFCDAGIGLSFCQQIVIEGDGRTHIRISVSLGIYISIK